MLQRVRRNKREAEKSKVLGLLPTVCLTASSISTYSYTLEDDESYGPTEFRGGGLQLISKDDETTVSSGYSYAVEEDSHTWEPYANTKKWRGGLQLRSKGNNNKELQDVSSDDEDLDQELADTRVKLEEQRRRRMIAENILVKAKCNEEQRRRRMIAENILVKAKCNEEYNKLGLVSTVIREAAEARLARALVQRGIVWEGSPNSVALTAADANAARKGAKIDYYMGDLADDNY